jgi:electron transport complex protein RnfB
MSLAERIDELLPQTQCTQCGFSGCRPYAEAIARGEAEINQCPPGGARGIAQLAALLGHKIVPLDPAHGVEKPPAAALIDEDWCIGCTLCIQACPVDAIMGAARRMHTVLLDQCTGCELCVAPCPVDCIAIVARSELHSRGARLALEGPTAQDSRARYLRRQARVEREREEQRARLAHKAGAKLRELDLEPASEQTQPKRATIQRALENARARRSAS